MRSSVRKSHQFLAVFLHAPALTLRALGLPRPDPAGERGGRQVQLACDRTNRPLLIQDQPYGPCFELLGELSSYPSSRLA